MYGPERILHSEERPSPLNHRCPRCRRGAEHPTISVVWYRDGSVSQWWKCGCGSLNPTTLAIDPLPL